MSDDPASDDSETRVTRREAMGGGAAAAATMMGLATGTASAQQGTEPRIQLGDDWEIDDVDRGDGTTDLALRHLPSGSTFVFDGDDQSATLPELVTDEVRGGVTGGNAVTNLFGDGLEYASGAVRVLSSIWDSANQVLTADVNNSSVVTESVSTGDVSSKVADGVVRANHPDFSGLQDAIDFVNNGDAEALYLPGGKGSGPNGEYVVTAGSGEHAVSTRRDMRIFGDGTQTVIKLADAQASDYNSIVRLKEQVTLQNVTIDGNAANQTDGGTETLQAGLSAATNNQDPDVTVENVRIRDVQYRGAFLTGLPSLTVRNLRAENCGNRGIHIEDRTGGTSDRITADGLVSIGTNARSGGTNDEGGVVIGDDLADSTFTNVISKNDVGSGIWVEFVENCQVSGVSRGAGEEGLRTNQLTRGSIDVSVVDSGGDGALLSDSTSAQVDINVRGAGARGVVGVNSSNMSWDLTAYAAQNEAVDLQGVRNGRVDITASLGDQAGGGDPDVRIGTDTDSSTASGPLTIPIYSLGDVTIDSGSDNLDLLGHIGGAFDNSGTGNTHTT